MESATLDMKTYSVQGIVNWLVKDTEGVWVAVCPTLSLTLQANTLDRLKDDIDFALSETLSDLFEAGQLESTAAAHGWVIETLPNREDAEFKFVIPFSTNYGLKDGFHFQTA